MQIERQNIFDLIGRDQNRYAHCIITTFSFDFTFFEERVMRALRAANIRNINVLVDEKHLDNLLEHTTALAASTSKSYSLIPVSSKGVFHPKIMLLAGQKHGLLVIGSGNLTSSGMSNNDEVWGAFHLDGLDSPNASIFAAAWRYLLVYAQQAKGIHQRKIGWFNTTAPWLNELLSYSAASVAINKNTTIQFIANIQGASTLAQLLEQLPHQGLAQMSVIAPYYDKDAKLVKQLMEVLQPVKVACVIDEYFGILPTGIANELKSKIAFYSWLDCVGEDDSTFNRLHAKMFHFRYQDGREFLLLGSANATRAAFGNETEEAVNAEAGLLLERTGGKNYLEELGINFKKANPKDISLYTSTEHSKGDSETRSSYENRIAYAELVGRKVQLQLEHVIEHEFEVGILSFPAGVPMMYAGELHKHEFYIDTNKPEQSQFVALFANKKRISTIAHICNTDLLLKTNPDARLADIQGLANRLLANPDLEGYADLLRHVDYDWIDEEFNTERQKRLLHRKGLVIGSSEPVEYQKIDEAGYNSLSSVQQRQAEMLLSGSSFVTDLLGRMSRGLDVIQEINENHEQALSVEMDSEQEGNSNEDLHKELILIDGEREKKAIFKHMDTVENWFKSKLSDLISERVLTAAPNRPITLKEVQNMSSALSLLIMFHGKKFTEQKTRFAVRVERAYLDKIEKIASKFGLNRIDKTNPEQANLVYYEVNSRLWSKLKKELETNDYKSSNILVNQDEYETILYQHDYLHDGTFTNDESSGIKGYLFYMVGSFLLCANSKAGFREYEYAPINARLQSERFAILSKAVFLILNLHWNEREAKYKNILLLDLLHFIYPSHLMPLQVDTIKEELEVYASKCKRVNKAYRSNLIEFVELLLPDYLQWLKAYSNPLKEGIKRDVAGLKTGQIVFNSSLGFSTYLSKKDDDILLNKACYVYDEYQKAFLLKLIYPLKSILTFPTL